MTIKPSSATTEGSSPKAPAVPLPSAMPRKVNPIRLQILGELVENKPRRLTNNVSEHSVNRLAKRWIR